MSAPDRLDVPLVAPQPARDRRSSEYQANVFSRLTFAWLSNTIGEGYRRERNRARLAAQGGDIEAAVQNGENFALTEDDLCELRPDDVPEVIQRIAKEQWAAQVQKPLDQQRIRSALWKGFGTTWVIGGCFKFVYDSLQMVGPTVLGRMLKYLHSCQKGEKDLCTWETGFMWCGLLFATNVIQTAVLHQYFQRCFRTGMRLCAAATTLIYGKSLRISGPGKISSGEGGATRQGAQERTSGEIVNLMSVDAQRLQEATTYLHTIWSGPYQICFSLVLLVLVVDWAMFAGLAVMMLQIPLVGLISRRVKLAQRALMKEKDERVKLTNEIFSAVKLLKMYGWEESFEQRLTAVREKELRFLRRYQVLSILSQSTYLVAPILTGVATFGVYTLIHGELTAEVAFSAQALFNVLRFPLIMFPNMITSAIEASVALKRIQDFLSMDEVQGRPPLPEVVFDAPSGENGDKPSSQDSLKKSPCAVQVQGAKLQWPGGVPLLSDISFDVPAATKTQTTAHITAVTGAVGCGKSGLLQALIGDLTPVAGSIAVSGKIAYTSQVAWIRNATLKENILFGSPYDPVRYEGVIKACALQPDLETLPNGEDTEIGEKGVNLSGGQKQRVSLARAVYADADLLLLDDPLSAVDSEVAKKLLRMLRGPLVKNTSIIICTHHHGAIQQADQVILLERMGGGTVESKLAFCGPPQDLAAKRPDVIADVSGNFERSVSTGEAVKTKDESKEKAGRLIQKEAEMVGDVQWKVYKTYIDAAGGLCVATCVIIGLIFSQGLQSGADAWVSYWTDHHDKASHDVKGPEVSTGMGIGVYAGLSLLAFCGVCTTTFMFRMTALRASRHFHYELVSKMLRLPMSFYDTTPLGRVMNRFSKDIYTVDEQLVQTLIMFFQTLCRVGATVVIISYATQWFLAVMIPLGFVYYFISRYYIPSSRQFKRIESNLKSPVFSHFSETLDGVSSIRAFEMQDSFVSENLQKMHRNMRAYYLNFSSNRWLAVRLESLGTAIVTAAAVFAVVEKDKITSGIAGLSISYALSVTQALNWVVRMSSDRETNIVAVERISEYIHLDPEPPRELPRDPSPGSWPSQGHISFEAVQLRYRENLPLVLNELTLDVQPKEKLGICGRTGAGKSSLLNVLLRIVDPCGGVCKIDGVDVMSVGLHRLRKAITVLPQDPVLFSGTLRFNLDPFNEQMEAALWEALERAHLADHAQALARSTLSSTSVTACLDAKVAEKGENFSLGQRQQLCLARALLRSNKILLLDEATSAVDVETDRLIQDTISTEFREHTLLCIAHRIATVMTCDKVCVVEAGKVGELGAPTDLIKQEGSRFKFLAEQDMSR